MAKTKAILLIPFYAITLLTSCDTYGDKQSESIDYNDFGRLNTEFNQAIAAKDIDRILRLYSDEMIWLPPNAKRQSGITPVRNNYLGITQNPAAELSHRLDTAFVAASGDLAVMIGTYYFKLNGDKILTDTGKFSLTLVKENGNWKIHSDLFNSDLLLNNQ